MDRAWPVALPEQPLSVAETERAETGAASAALAEGGSDADRILEAARAHARESRRDVAIETLRKGILAHPRSADMLSTLGDLLSRTGAFEEADLSPMAASFYAENKRVRNARIKADLGVALRYPTYRDGLRAIAALGI